MSESTFQFRKEIYRIVTQDLIWRSDTTSFANSYINCLEMRVRRVRACANYMSKISNTMIIHNASREEIWKELNVNYWTNDRIRIDLEIDEKTYKIIYAFLEGELIRSEVLNDKFNHVSIKRKLQSIFITIKDQYSTVFDNVDSTWKEACLLHWTQRVNNNCKRRRADLMSSKKSCNINSIIKSQAFNFAFDAVTFLFRKEKNCYNEMCRPEDMIISTIFTEKITMKHLKFDMFVQILKEDVNMNSESKSIHCELYGLEDAKNQRCDFFRFWKVAISEMYSYELRYLQFFIRSNQSKSSVQTKKDMLI